MVHAEGSKSQEEHIHDKAIIGFTGLVTKRNYIDIVN